MTERINKRKMMKMRLKKVSIAIIISLMRKSQARLRAVLRGSISKRGIKKLRKPLSNHSKYLWIASQILVYSRFRSTDNWVSKEETYKELRQQ